MIYWFLAFHVVLWHFGGTRSFLPHLALTVPWLEVDHLDLLLSFPLLYKSVVRGVVGVFGRVASHRHSTDILAPFLPTYHLLKRHSPLFLSFSFSLLFYLLPSSSFFFFFPHPPTHPVVGYLDCFLFVTFSPCFTCVLALLIALSYW